MLATGAVGTSLLTGLVVGVATDGETIKVLDAGKTRYCVRVAAIDAPERGQPGAQRSKENLSSLVYGQPVRLESQKRDRFGGVVGKVRVTLAGTPCRGNPDCPMTPDAGLAQITMRRAGWFRKYAEAQSPEGRRRCEFAGQEARSGKVGPWRDGTAAQAWERRATYRR